MDDITECLVKYYEQNYSRMIKIANNITKELYDSEDIVQETFHRALKYKKSFNAEISDLHQWVNGIFSRCIKDFHRDKRLQGMSVEIKDDDAVSGETIGEDNRTLEEIEEMIKRISNPINKQVCFLHFIQQYTPREIVQVVDTTVGNIRTVMWKFRKDLKVVYG
jgi:RNA polymerase sigma factor (sigma-70 family)